MPADDGEPRLPDELVERVCRDMIPLVTREITIGEIVGTTITPGSITTERISIDAVNYPRERE
jgi:hypothetical protein